jgi:uncharacterized protein YeaO (DUF488 family)
VAAHQVHAARVYGPQPAAGATRVLVDRLWPRGISKAAAPFGEWVRDVAPSTELRKWYGHDPVKFGEFTCRYRQELTASAPAAAFDRLRDLLSQQDLVLLTAVKDLDLSHAEVLATLLRDPTTFI